MILGAQVIKWVRNWVRECSVGTQLGVQAIFLGCTSSSGCHLNYFKIQPGNTEIGNLWPVN